LRTSALFLYRVLTLGGLTLLSSANADESLDLSAAWQFDGAAEVWAYQSMLSRVKDSLFNPANAIAHLPDGQSIVDLRGNLRASSDGTELLLQPRLLAQRSVTDDHRETDGSLYMSQAYLRIRPEERTSMTAGRIRYTWGPANFRSPSNPFYFDAGKNQPLLDVPGIDMVRADYSATNSQWTAAWISDAGHLTRRPDISNVALIKADVHQDGWRTSAILATRESGKAFFGVFGQYPIGDALIVYGEVGNGHRSTVPLSAAERSAGDRLTTARASTALFGASYTRINGQMLAAEYLFDGHGLRTDQADRYFSAAAEASLAFRSSSDAAVRAAGAASLGRMLNGMPGLLGRHYGYLLWQSNPQESGRYWRVSLASDLQDGSAQALLFSEINVSRYLSMFGSVTINHGRPETEFGSLVSRVLSVGAKLFLI
jgi:hypothetical protein